MSREKNQQLLQQAIALFDKGRHEGALTLCQRICATDRGNFEATYLGGVILLFHIQAAKSLPWWERAIRLRPRDPKVNMCLGVAYSTLSRLAEAEKPLRQASELDPNSAEIWGHYGGLLTKLQRWSEAAHAHLRAAELEPTYAAHFANAGWALAFSYRPLEAIDAYTKALALDPEHRCRINRGQQLSGLHRITEALADLEYYINRHPEEREPRDTRLYLLNYCAEISREKLFEEHLIYGRLFPAAKPQIFPNTRDVNRRLKLAIISPDLRAHPCAFFLEPILAHLDRERFEIILYHDQSQSDWMTQRLQVQADLWRQFVHLPGEMVEPKIRADQPDILVDLAGHTSLNRLPLFARRLAPVQLSYLGYPNTSGVKEVDYRFTDAVADPVGVADDIHTERLVRFSSTAWAYLPPTFAPEPTPPPILTGAPVVFGSFNSLSKVNDFTLRLWGDILRAVPNSRLFIKTYNLGAEPADFSARVAAAGLDVSRVTYLPNCPSIELHLASYSKIDIALDPYPYHGTTTTCEALWMGRPVISLAGDRHASRVGASLLTAVGRSEWVASNTEEYVAIARRLASDPAELGRICAGLRDAMQQSPILDHPGQARRFGAALEQCWADWCATAEQEPVEVTATVAA